MADCKYLHKVEGKPNAYFCKIVVSIPASYLKTMKIKPTGVMPLGNNKGWCQGCLFHTEGS